MSNLNNFNNLIVFYFTPSDLEKQMPDEFLAVENEILQDIEQSQILSQKFLNINKIMIHLERNTHLGENTYSCKINLSSPDLTQDYVHEVEGKNFLQNIRSCVKELIQFVRSKNSKIESKQKNPNSKSF